MQVDKNNLSKLLPEILSRIESSDFVAFDCEFTGLVAQLERIEGQFSNYIEFYERIKQTALNFRIIQFGVAAFVYEDNLYKPYVYNIYVSPSTWSKGYNNIMVCEVESLQFLIKNKLDFAQVLNNGIKSSRLYSQDEVQKHKYNDVETFDPDNFFFSPQQNKIVKSFEEIIEKELMEKPKTEYQINFGSRALFNYFKKKYPSLSFDKNKKNLSQFQYILKFNEKTTQQVKDKEEDQVADKDKINDIQFKEESLEKIFQLLIKTRKPLVGHFPNLDIGLIYHNFIADLPQRYEQFCANLNNIFPQIYDTKVISRRLQSQLKGIKVDLPSLFKACSNPKLLKPYSNLNLEGFEQYKEKQHEAGYDAFITGSAFVGMANFLAGSADRVNFALLQKENKLFYSRFSGQVSLNGNGYSSNAVNYDSTILIHPFSKAQNHNWREIAQTLSCYGNLTVSEDRGETYYVFQQPQKLDIIVQELKHLNFRRYWQRRIIPAKNMYPKMI